MSLLYGRNDVCGSCSAMNTLQAGNEVQILEERPVVRVQPGPHEGHRSLDEQEFQRFYQDNLGLIYRFAFRHVGNREEAEDLTSQIFLKVVRGLDTERDSPSMHRWLFRVARTTIADYWRAHYRTPAQSLDALMEAGWDASAEEDAVLVSIEAANRVQCILQALPERYRDVLTCRFLLTLSIKDTALRMGLTETNVKTLQFRALKCAAELKITDSQSGVR